MLLNPQPLSELTPGHEVGWEQTPADEEEWRKHREAAAACREAHWRACFESIESGILPGADAPRTLLRSLSIYPGVRAEVERVVTTPGEYMSYADGHGSETYLYHSPTRGILLVVRYIGYPRYDALKKEWCEEPDREEWHRASEEEVRSILIQSMDGERVPKLTMEEEEEEQRAIFAAAAEMAANATR